VKICTELSPQTLEVDNLQNTYEFHSKQLCGRKKRENAPRNLLQNLHGENFQNASQLHRKQLRFETHRL